MGKNSQRVQAVRKRVRQVGSLQLSSVARDFGVSEMTIRRDTDDILLDPEIQLIRGTFLYLPEASNRRGEPYSLLTAALTQREAKERIARRALDFIEPGQNFLFDAGSTVEILSSIVPPEMNGTAFCFSYNVLQQLLDCKELTVHVSGGRFHRRSMVFESQQGVEMVRQRRFHTAFLSASGVHQRLGVTTSDDYETELKRAGLESAEQRVLLVDSSKFGKFTPHHFADIDQFDIIITDNLLNKNYQNRLANGTTRLILV